MCRSVIGAALKAREIRTKELIGIAIAGATRCRNCALFHTEAASTFLNALQVDHDQFRRETMDMIAYARQHQPPAKSGRQPHAAAH